MHQSDDTDPPHEPGDRPAVLSFDPLHTARVARVLTPIIEAQAGIRAISDPTTGQLPEGARHQTIALQIIGDNVVADPIEMLRHVGAGVVLRPAEQVFDVRKLRNHGATLPICRPERKSYSYLEEPAADEAVWRVDTSDSDLDAPMAPLGGRLGVRLADATAPLK